MRATGRHRVHERYRRRESALGPDLGGGRPLRALLPNPLGGPVGGVSYHSEQHISTGPAISATIGRHTDNSSAEVRIDSRPVEPVDPYSRHRRGHSRYPVYGYGAAGTWVRDECHALPQMEVCGRLRDRRDEIRRRFFNAQPTERATLDREQRGINARLSADCGGS